MGHMFEYVRTMLADYTDTQVEEFDMSEDLDLIYQMDSTELTEFAKHLAQQFNIIVAKSDRTDWRTGNDIVAFLRRVSGADCTAAGQ